MKKLFISFILILISGALALGQRGQILKKNAELRFLNRASETNGPTPDYSDLRFWAASPFKHDTSDSIPQFLKDEVRTERADVFFIHPTSFISRRTTSSWNADLNAEEINHRTDYRSILYQASVFNGSCRIFAPRYRQVNLKAFFVRRTPEAERAFDLAYQDVKKAFLYYLENHNNGRPIIIASHSQGTLHAIRLLQELFDGQPLQRQLVCAYIIGYQIEKNAFRNIPVGERPDQTHCFVGWRSMAKGEIPPMVEPEMGNSVCVNPLNWSVSEKWISPDYHLGIMKGFKEVKPNTAGAGIEPATKILWVDFQGRMEKRARRVKNLHVYDYNLFWMNIRQNIKERIEAYYKNSNFTGN